MSRCALTSPPSHKRVLTIMASAIHTMRALFLDADLIGLDLPQVPWLFDQVLVHGLPLASGASPPSGDRPLVKAESGHNRLHRAAMGEQGHDDAPPSRPQYAADKRRCLWWR